MNRCLLVALALALVSATSRAAPVGIIFDTDMSTDVDDVGALAVLNKLANLGEARMLACVTNNGVKEKAIGGCIAAIDAYYGNGSVPIGTYHGTKYATMRSAYVGAVRDAFAPAEPPDDQLPAALQVYRRALAAAPDGSVTCVSVGFLCNLEELLKSPPDADSPLGGLELVRKKVRQLVMMGGRYPSGREYNLSGSGTGPESAYVIAHWPTPILFSGFEIGLKIITGVRIQSTPASNPARRAYELYNHFAGRPSWDDTAVLAAVRDPQLYWDLSPDGCNHVAPDGSNRWSPTPPRGHRYLIARVPPSEVAAVLDHLATLPPGPSK